MTVNKEVLYEFNSEVKDMVRNIAAIHGQKTGNFVWMQCNVLALMRLWVEGTSEHPQRDKMSAAFALIMQQMAHDAAELGGLSEADCDAADKLLEVIARKYQDMERRATK